jgi:hypothetical protein
MNYYVSNVGLMLCKVFSAPVLYYQSSDCACECKKGKKKCSVFSLTCVSRNSSSATWIMPIVAFIFVRPLKLALFSDQNFGYKNF